MLVSSYREKTDQYRELIKARDSDGIMELLTDIAVEVRRPGSVTVWGIGARAFCYQVV